MNSVISLLSVLIITILILYLSYIFTKSIGKGMVIKRGGNCMQMLDRLPLGQDKSVAVVRAGSHYFLIGIASSQITILAELTEEDIQESLDIPNPQVRAGYPDFISILKKYTDKNRKDM
ncbi:MAG: flagellar biosynthesis protein FliZ [Lacrimispora sp.]|nr:flagellar biosynthesis protein FliZ [Lacrimispora sp.]